ncbi:MAG TPA: SDR family NAD(P)-dependent oxidoreductase [Streptosporangiaceae bacterium]|nr:SDR family NAD(P)-dependent oxidoreductase [Streptosporangiaceae bacterium]
MTAAIPTGYGDQEPALEPIAIIGIGCRLPGASDPVQFWRNLANGTESIRRWTRQEQLAIGVTEQELEDPAFVPVAAVPDDAEFFDAAFFGMTAREAQVRDPQQRLFLEMAYMALEDGGYDPSAYRGDIGVYAGSGEDAYQWLYTRRNRAAYAAVGMVGLAVSSHPDYVATLASYKLNLRGPSMTLHTACSTSLVAVHIACEALRNGECDMALGGGVNVDLPLGRGYLHMEGGVHSSDGRCRAFDAQADGTVWGSGGGVVLLKRLSDAQADGDHIYAIILGNAINNDGSAKAGFTAPSHEGQAEVIAQAVAAAGISPRTVSYVEAHGTGTALGDPIEVAALSSVFRQYSADVGWCAIGTVKTNIGHLGPSAGVTGLIKTALALEHRLIPASLHYEEPNPKIDFGSNPFYVNASLAPWEADGGPRRACVSSFGMGGTNAHVVLEEAPDEDQERRDDRPVHLLQLSARTPKALTTAAARLAAHLEATDLDLADVARTLRVGRAEFPERLAVTAASTADAVRALADSRRQIASTAPPQPPRVALMFPGQGAQYAGMGAQLYAAEPAFRRVVDECAQILTGYLGADLRELMLAAGSAEADGRLRQTEVAQPALFVIEYALALLWRDWGVRPAGMVGHSIGEYVAATLAGVFELPDAIALVAARGRLMQSLPPGAMLAVQLAEDELRQLLSDDLALSAVNGPHSCVVAGPAAQVDGFAAKLAGLEVASRRLRTSHAFHSPMMEPVLAQFRSVVADVQRRPPAQPFLSNVTGGWITDSEATDPSYWALQTRETVRFADCLATMAGDGDWLLVECGPGQQLSGLARLTRGSGQVKTVPSLRRRDGRESDLDALYAAAGQLWVSGVTLDRETFGAAGRRVPLPPYPWQREYYWIKPDISPDAPAPALAGRSGAGRPVDDWFTVPAWEQLPMARQEPPCDRCLIFADQAAGPLVAAVRAVGPDVIVVRSAAESTRGGDGEYAIRPDSRADFEALFADLGARGWRPDRLIHAWALDGSPADGAEAVWRAQDRGFFSLLGLVQAVASATLADGLRLDVITSGTQRVTGPDLTRPEHATVAGVTKVIPLELPGLLVRHIDIGPVADLAGSPGGLAGRLAQEIFTEPAGDVALRQERRWQCRYQPVRVPRDAAGLPPGPGLRDRGVYLITGGLGGIGITLAEHLAASCQARLVLVSRSGLPPRAGWDAVLAESGSGGPVRRAIAAIARMEASGAEVTAGAADVTSEADLLRLREQVLARFGRLDGIVHAAGVPGGGMAEVKDRAAAEHVLLPKVIGTVLLQHVFGDLEPDFIVLCSSVTAVTGGFGQVDYCAANNFLDAFANAHPAGRASVVSVNWGRWLERGMAAEVTAPVAFRALERGEALIAISHPVVTAKHEAAGEAPAWCGGVISSDRHWILDEHRIEGVPVLPGTGYLEVVRCAAQAVLPASGQAIELRDIAITRPLAVPDGASAELRVVFSRAADGLEFEVVSLADGTVRTHARGTAALARDDQAAERADLSAIIARCSPSAREAGPARDQQAGLVQFGSRWRSLRQVYLGQNEQLALLEAGDTVAAELADWVLHPALLDEALNFAELPGDGSYLPLGYGRITVHDRMPARIWSHVRFHDTESGEIVASDITLLDETGRQIVSLGDYTVRRMEREAMRTAVSPGVPGAVRAGREQGAAGAAGSPLTGIRPDDGAVAFARLIGVDLGRQVAITAEPLEQIAALTRGLTQETLETQLGPLARSDGGDAVSTGEFVAPRTELEQLIAQIWAEVLGLDQVSVTADFAELGGNSLIAVQIISMVRKETGIRLPMRSLFNEPTVAGAAAIAEQLKASAEPTG